MFAQVFDKNGTSLVAKGGHVEEEKRPGGGVIRWWKRHRHGGAGAAVRQARLRKSALRRQGRRAKNVNPPLRTATAAAVAEAAALIDARIAAGPVKKKGRKAPAKKPAAKAKKPAKAK